MTAVEFFPRGWKDWLKVAVLAGLYILAAKLSLTLAIVNPSATPVWPPTGIAISALLVLGYRFWPAIFLGAFLSNLTTAGTAATSLGIALGNTLEGFTAAYLVDRFAGGKAFCERPQDVFKFVGFAALLGPALSATIGVATLTLGGFAQWSTDGRVWLTWWLGDAGGALTVAPLLVLWSTQPLPRLKGGRVLEAALMIVSLVVVGEAVFGGLLPEPFNNAPLPSLSIPILLWAGFRFGPRETATASLVFAALAILGTVRGSGPFIRPDPNDSLIILQTYICLAATMALAFAAAVSERRRAEANLRHAFDELDNLVKARTEELTQANAELQLFTTVASHDLQAPIHKISSFAELLENRQGPLDDVGRDMLRRIRKVAHGMSRLVQDLLSLSRVMRDTRPLEVVDLKEVLADSLADLELRVEQAKVKVEAADLPKVRAHPTQMRQLFENIIGNAIKFRDPKNEPVIKIGARIMEKGYVEIDFADNGIGFDPAQAERIFQPFVSLYVKGEYAGSGIGLAICRRIAIRHGGSISAKSVLGQGSVFTVTLPYSP